MNLTNILTHRHLTIDIECLMTTINKNLKQIEDKLHSEGKPMPNGLRTELNKILIAQIIEDYNFEVNSLER